VTRAVLLFLSCLVIVSAVAFAQSLADVAKKEKERRKELTTESEVIDEKALAEADGETFSSTGKPAGASKKAGRARNSSLDSNLPSSTDARTGGDTTSSGGKAAAFETCVSEYRRAQSQLSTYQRTLDNGVVAHRTSTVTDRVTRRGTTVETEAAGGKKLRCSYVMARPNEFGGAASKCRSAKMGVETQGALVRQLENKCMGLARGAGISPGDARKRFR